MNKDEESATQSAMLIQELNRAYGLALAESPSAEQMEALLADKLNTMIRTDFSALVQLLYRIDINENRLRQLLAHQSPVHSSDVPEGETGETGKIIARLIIERQRQKIQTRRQYASDSPLSSGPEWKEV